MANITVSNTIDTFLQSADAAAAKTAIECNFLPLAGGTLSGALNFSGTTHAGLRLNNLTTTQRDAIATPSAGMTVWNTTQVRMNVYNGSAWTDGFVRLAGDAMTGALSVTLTGLGTTPSAGFTLANSTDAALGAQQVSPSFVLEGRGYRSTTSVGSQIVRFRQNLLPVEGVSASPTATWRLQSEINNSGSWADNATVDSSGNLTVTSLRFFNASNTTQIRRNSDNIEFVGSGNVVCTMGLSALSGLSMSTIRALHWGTQFYLWSDATNSISMRNGTSGQSCLLFGTYTDANNYRRVALTMTNAGVASIKPEGLGTGASGNVLHISGLPTSNPGPGILWNNAGTPAIGT